MSKIIIIFMIFMIAAANLSAQEGYIYFNRYDQNRNMEIWRIRPDGSSLEQITNQPGIECSPCTSPDGTILYYIADYNKETAVYSHVLATGAVTRISPVYQEIYDLSISRDGGKILLSGLDPKLPDNDFDIYLMNSDGSGVTRLIANPGPDTFPRLTPDGNSVVFQSERGAGYQIYLYSIQTGKTTRLTSKSQCMAFSPCLTPDGKKILYGLYDRSATSGLYQMDLSGANSKLIYKYPAGELCPTVSPDGRQAVVSILNETHRNQLFAVNLDGSSSRCFTAQDASYIFPYWSN
ncbi:MAG: hypothetical protein PHW04_10960 [Candidatus Wallbacteria bacterium]|nr:hypothetical protein [Candidatus Wallbacteria bacterium]